MFEYDRNAMNEEGQRLPERCSLAIVVVPGMRAGTQLGSLAIVVVPGMRAGTQFVFECEGDDGAGYVPGDVHVVL
ncbi:hypothetical protein T484DRAFT_1798405, partial [Baffinella frigidus]